MAAGSWARAEANVESANAAFCVRGQLGLELTGPPGKRYAVSEDLSCCAQQMSATGVFRQVDSRHIWLTHKPREIRQQAFSGFTTLHRGPSDIDSSLDRRVLAPNLEEGWAGHNRVRLPYLRLD